MSKEGILRYNYKPFSLQRDVFHMTKKKETEHNNGRCTMYVHFSMDAWYICGAIAFTMDTQTILPRGSGFCRNCLCGGRVPKLASRFTYAIGKVFFSKHRGFSCYIDK